MKKISLGMFAAILTSGLLITSCDKTDNSAYTEPFDPFERTTNVINFEDETTPFTADSRITVGVADNAGLGSKVGTFKGASNAQNGYSFAHYDFTELVPQAAIVTVSFDYYNANSRAIVTIGDAMVRGNGVGAGCAKTAYGSNGAIFRIGSDRDKFFVNGVTLGGVADWTGKWLKVNVKINNFDRQVEWTIKEGSELLAQSGTTEGEGDDAVFTPGAVDFYTESANEATQIDVFGYINNGDNNYLDNLSIESAIDTRVKFVDYTIRFVDADGNDIKESVTRNGRVGSLASLLDTDKASVYAADNSKKYIFDSDNTGTTPIAETGSEIVLKFREAETYYAVLQCMTGSTLLERFNDTNKYKFFEGDNLSIYPPLGYTKDGAAYLTTPTTSSDNKTYNCVTVTFPGTITPTVSGGKTYYIGTVNYELDENVVYYSDVERLALPTEDAGDGVGLGQLFGTVNSWISFSGSLFDRFSGARGIRLDADSYVWTEPIAEGGTYTVTIYGRNDSGDAADVPYVLGLRDADGNVTWIEGLTYTSWAGAVTGSNTVEGVTIPAGSSLVIKNDDAAKLISLDDIKITKPAAE